MCLPSAKKQQTKQQTKILFLYLLKANDKNISLKYFWILNEASLYKVISTMLSHGKDLADVSCIST